MRCKGPTRRDMLRRVTSAELLQTLERYYDTVPRSSATTEEVGPFTLFVKTDPSGWDFYARPRLGTDVAFTSDDVALLRARQRELGVGENIEWVHETTPSLLAAARAGGLEVAECPLLVRDPSATQAQTAGATGVAARILGPDSPDLAAVSAAIHAGFSGTDDVEPREPGRRPEMIRAGLLVMAGAYDGQGNVLGGGSHSPRGTTTEIAGIAVLPRARRRGAGAAITRTLAEDAQRNGVETVFLSAQDDTVARVYERVGFVRVSTACIAEPAEATVR